MTMNEAIVIASNKGYVVNNDGTVYSPFKKGLITPMLHNSGYYMISINKNYKVFVHRLMAYQKFGDSIFNSDVVVRHMNSDSMDNSYENINIGSHSDNMFDKSKDIRVSTAIIASTTQRKFSDDIMEEIRSLYKQGHTYKQLMCVYDISSKGTLHYILNNEYVTKK